MALLGLLRTVRRGWKLILVVTVLGAGAGVASGLAQGSTPVVARPDTHFVATETLVVTRAISDSPYSNLDQVAILTTSTAIVDRVATKLARSPDELAPHVTTIASSDAGTFAIRAVERSPAAAEGVASGFSTELRAFLREAMDTQFDEDRTSLATRLDELVGERRALDTTLAATPIGAPERTELEARRDALVNQYRIAYDRFVALGDSSQTQPPFDVLEHARARPISADEYQSALALASSGQNHVKVTADQPAPVPAAAGAATFALDGPIRRGIVGGLLGFVLAAGFVLVRDHFDRRLRTREEIEEAFGVPLLAEVPQLSRARARGHAVLAREDPNSTTAEAYRAVRSSVLLLRGAERRGGAESGDAGGRDTEAAPLASSSDGRSSSGRGRPGLVVMVTSGRPTEGKTVSSANLGVVLAESGASVLVVNCDFRRPALREHFGIADQPGVCVPSGVAGLDLLTNVAVPPGSNPGQVVLAQRELVDAVRSRYDVVVLDTAPLLVTNDALELLAVTDLVVLVVRAHLTRVVDAHRVRDLLARHQAEIAGSVCVGAGWVRDDAYYYYRGRAQTGAGDTAQGSVRFAPGTVARGEAESPAEIGAPAEVALPGAPAEAQEPAGAPVETRAPDLGLAPSPSGNGHGPATVTVAFPEPGATVSPANGVSPNGGPAPEPALVAAAPAAMLWAATPPPAPPLAPIRWRAADHGL